MAVHFSSKTDDWATPQDFFDKMNEKYGPFDLDVCASITNHKCEQYYSESDNGLVAPWTSYVPMTYGTWGHGTRISFPTPPEVSKCWMNPPYGREIGKWVEKAYDESLNGCLVCCLLPSRTDTRWFHDFILPYVGSSVYVEFIKGRLKFGDSKNSAPFPSMIVVFNPVKK